MSDVKRYTTKEVAKKLRLQVGKLKEWEDNFNTILYIQRSKTGARMYTEYEIDMLSKIKILKDKNVKDEDIRYILEGNSIDEIQEEFVSVDTSSVQEEANENYSNMIALHEETVGHVESLKDSFSLLKDEFLNEVKEELKSEIKKEIQIGQKQSKTVLENYSQCIVETTNNTYEEINKLRTNIEKDEEEKLYIQHKLEEREELFQQFVTDYREVAASKVEENTKRNWLQWVSFFSKNKKENSIDFS
ncbi:MerR family transcriptional regulator [Bacillus sp. FJAT-45350]|uniref:MerR family transcriptional regulator n=1 Tax=Bacillus sp. FJAT-45350 TaxID=2011014 RepID=UPI000BB85EE1|nr:MerR family transcriptional regulator [Bacillus sp. FJAT-45350]